MPFTQQLFRRGAFTQRNFYTEKLVHSEALTQRSFLHREAFTQTKASHRGAFTDRSWYAKKLSQTETFTHRGRFTKKLLHTEAWLLHKNKTYTEKFQKLLRKETFTRRNFYTQKLLHTEVSHKRKPFHRGTFTQRNLCAQTRLHTGAFAHRSFCTGKSLPIFHQVSFFMTIHHLSPSYLCFHALLVNSLRRLVFISHGVLSVHASSSFPLRRSKLNANPRINSI